MKASVSPFLLCYSSYDTDAHSLVFSFFSAPLLSISLVLIYSEGKDGIHYLFHTNPFLAITNASLAKCSLCHVDIEYSTDSTHMHACTLTCTQVRSHTETGHACRHANISTACLSERPSWTPGNKNSVESDNNRVKGSNEGKMQEHVIFITGHLHVKQSAIT